MVRIGRNLFGFAMAVLLVVAASALAGPGMFRGGPEHTGIYASPNPTLGSLAWRFRTGVSLVPLKPARMVSFDPTGTLAPRPRILFGLMNGTTSAEISVNGYRSRLTLLPLYTRSNVLCEPAFLTVL